MAKRLTLLSLRLLSLNAIAVVIAFFIMTPLVSIWKNTAYQWFITILFSFLMWLFVWLDCVNYGNKDVQKDKIIKRRAAEEMYQPSGEEGRLYVSWMGFAAGFLAQLPAFILVIVACFANDALKTTLGIPLRIWNITYMQAYISFEGALPYLFFLFPLLFSVVAGLAYMNGPVQQLRLETIIERNKAKKARRVQDEKKKKKSRSEQKFDAKYRR